MTVGELMSEFAGKRVQTFDPEEGLKAPSEVAYRVELDYDEASDGKTIEQAIGTLLADPKASQLEALLIGAWDFESSEDSSKAIKVLCENAERLPKLRALFLGDITCEQQEMSWIQQSDVTPLLTAYPALEELRVRGTEGIELRPATHANLKKLAFESGGLPRHILETIMRLDLPQLTHLELWLGDDGYGYQSCIPELQPVLSGAAFPALSYLGLKNCCEADKVAAAVAEAPILDRIQELDLGMGTLSDEGANALLASDRVRNLEKLSLSYHFVSPEVVSALEGMGMEVDASDPQEGYEYEGEIERYVFVSE